jgi:hypothetical protein
MSLNRARPDQPAFELEGSAVVSGRAHLGADIHLQGRRLAVGHISNGATDEQYHWFSLGAHR